MHDPLGHQKWLFLLACGCLIAPVSLFIHDFMLETLKVPYPTTVGLPTSVKFLNDLVRFASIAVISRLSLPPQYGLSRAIAASAVGLLVLMLNETLRVLAIETAIVGNGWYAVFDIAPRALCSFAGGFAAAWFGLGKQKPGNVALAMILVAALVVFAIHPALDIVFALLKKGLVEPMPLYTDPYPLKINLLIYVTFIEPTLATFIMAAFCWPALGGSLFHRVVAFAALLLLARGRLIQFCVESFWVQQPLSKAFLAEGQFFLETLTLGMLVAFAWGFSARIP